MKNNVDNTSALSYNDSNNDLNDFVIDVAQNKPINDIDCKHVQLRAEPEDTIGDAVYHGCVNPRCGVGFYLKPTNKNIT